MLFIHKVTDKLLKYYFLWGMIIAVFLRILDVKRTYYATSAMAIVFVILFYICHRTLHIREFLLRYWMLFLTVVMDLLYQTFRIGLSHRALLRGATIYILIYSGFLFGKKYIKNFKSVLKPTALVLAITSVIGIIWWILGIWPLEIVAKDPAKYFYSAPQRMVSVFVHPILAGCFMLLLISISLFVWRDENGLNRKNKKSIVNNKKSIVDAAIKFLLAFIGIAGLYATFTRSAYLVMIFMIIVWAYGMRTANKMRNRSAGDAKNICSGNGYCKPSKEKRSNALVIVVFSLAIIAIILATLYFTGIAGTIYTRFFGTNWRDDPSYTFRMDTLSLTAANVFGRGFGSFLFGMGAGKGDDILKNATWLIEKYEVVPAIDNSFSTMFLEQGIFAFVLFVSELIYMMKKCLHPDISILLTKTNNTKDNKIGAIDDISYMPYILLPQLIMAITFDAQTWPSSEFVIFVLIGIEMACRKYPHPGFSKKHPLIINGRIFAQSVTGVQRYGIEIIKQIDKLVEPGEVILALPQGDLVSRPDFQNIKTERVGKGNGNKWTQFYLPMYAYKKRGTLLGFAGIAPVIKPDYIATHDISFMRYPASYGKAFRWMYRIGYLLTLYRCKGIITISEFSRDELICFYRLDESRFTIAGNSAEQILEQMDVVSVNGKEKVINTLSKWGLKEGEPYYLSVGSKNLHKNQRFIKKLAKKYPDRIFVVAGGSSQRSFAGSGDMDDSDAAQSDKNKVPQNLILTGYISDEELLLLYSNAYAFIFPSLYEGFGIPPMEAIMAGVKRIALADIPVFREIYTRGCYFFDPTDAESFDIERIEADFTGKVHQGLDKANKVQTNTSDNFYITDEIRQFYIKKYSWKNSAKSIIGMIR